MITSLVLYTVLANYYWTEDQSGVAQIAWGDKEYFKLTRKMGIPFEEIDPIIFSMVREPMDPEKNNPEAVRKFEMIEEFYQKALQIKGLRLITNEEDKKIHLLEEKDWDEEDKVIGEYAMFNINGQGYETLYSYFVDSEYLDYFKVRLSEGEYFKDIDYLYNNDYIPVLMGNNFKKYYTLGEEFMVQEFDKPLKVIGFIATNQYYSPVNRQNMIFSYDTRVLLPYMERNLEEVFYYNKYVGLYTSRFTNSYYIADSEDYERIHQEVLDLLDEVGLGEYYETFKIRIAKELSSNYKDQLAISI
ncbi:MAG: hypothetical protein J6B51_01695, partial [Clostridia bacterium]|nr:hypothetical protein [Clostridia bacterium]